MKPRPRPRLPPPVRPARPRPLSIGWLTACPPHDREQPSLVQQQAKERGWIFEHRDAASPDDLAQVAREWTAREVDAAVLGYTTPFGREMPFPWERFVAVSSGTARLQDGFDAARPSHFL